MQIKHLNYYNTMRPPVYEISNYKFEGCAVESSMMVEVTLVA